MSVRKKAVPELAHGHPRDVLRDSLGRERVSFSTRTHRRFVRAVLAEWQMQDGRDRSHLLNAQSVDLPRDLVEATRLRLAHKPDMETVGDE